MVKGMSRDIKETEGYQQIMSGEVGYRAFPMPIEAVMDAHIKNGHSYSMNAEFIMWQYVYELLSLLPLVPTEQHPEIKQSLSRRIAVALVAELDSTGALSLIPVPTIH